MNDIKRKKKEIRLKIWELLEEKGVTKFPKPVIGRIPNFKGAEQAAVNLTMQPEWRGARVVFVNPDSPQKHVRLLALMQGKVLVMATPRLREGFLLLDPKKIPPYRYSEASTIRGAFKWGSKIYLDVPKIDLKVTGSVAVDPMGRRLGKGHGYSEIEYGILGEIGALNSDTPVATTVHELQIVKEVPKEEHDMPVQLIVTPKRIMRADARGKPKILWELVNEEILREIPILRKLKEMRSIGN